MSAMGASGLAALEPSVARLIVAFFGANASIAVQQISEGRSARGVFKLIVDGTSYALRLSNERFTPSAWRDEVRSTELAAERGVAPALHLARPELGLVLMDWVEPEPVGDAMAAVAACMAELHRCTEPPAGLSLFGWLDEQHASALALLPVGRVRDAVLQWAPLRRAVQVKAKPALCHQEPNPGNICFSAGKAWLIDWESAGAGDPLYDLASVSNWFLWEGPSLEQLLAQYLDRKPSEQ